MNTATFRIPHALWISAKADVPCERCAFVPTPTGACICREVPDEG